MFVDESLRHYWAFLIQNRTLFYRQIPILNILVINIAYIDCIYILRLLNLLSMILTYYILVI